MFRGQDDLKRQHPVIRGRIGVVAVELPDQGRHPSVVTLHPEPTALPGLDRDQDSVKSRDDRASIVNIQITKMAVDWRSTEVDQRIFLGNSDGDLTVGLVLRTSRITRPCPGPAPHLGR